MPVEYIVFEDEGHGFLKNENKIRGFGLGLTICQKIVHLHSGTITVESEPGRGATMIVELPRAPAAKQVQPAAPVA